MSKGEPWLGTPTANFHEAHPRIEDLEFEINNSAFGHYNSLGHNPIKVTTSNVRARYACPNPRCKSGGLDFDKLLSSYSYGKVPSASIDDRFPCGGYEIKRTGRSHGRDCDNYFAVKGTITFKD